MYVMPTGLNTVTWDIIHRERIHRSASVLSVVVLIVRESGTLCENVDDEDRELGEAEQCGGELLVHLLIVCRETKITATRENRKLVQGSLKTIIILLQTKTSIVLLTIHNCHCSL